MRAFENDLFRIEAVAPRLWLLSEKAVKFSIRSNVWILEGRDADLVIDAGWGPVDWPMEALFPETGKPLWLALTHAHCDHMCQAARFTSRRFGHRLTGEVLRAPDALNTNAQPWTPQLKIIDEGFEHLGFDARAYGQHFEPAPLTDELAEGDVIDLGGTVLDVLETPGHSPDSLSFIDRERGWLFSGDVLMNGYIVDVLADSNKLDILRTHERLGNEDFELCLGGHQRPMDRAKAQAVMTKYSAHKAAEGITLARATAT